MVALSTIYIIIYSYTVPAMSTNTFSMTPEDFRAALEKGTESNKPKTKENYRTQVNACIRYDIMSSLHNPETFFASYRERWMQDHGGKEPSKSTIEMCVKAISAMLRGMTLEQKRELVLLTVRGNEMAQSLVKKLSPEDLVSDFDKHVVDKVKDIIHENIVKSLAEPPKATERQKRNAMPLAELIAHVEKSAAKHIEVLELAVLSRANVHLYHAQAYVAFKIFVKANLKLRNDLGTTRFANYTVDDNVILDVDKKEIIVASPNKKHNKREVIDVSDDEVWSLLEKLIRCRRYLKQDFLFCSNKKDCEPLTHATFGKLMSKFMSPPGKKIGNMMLRTIIGSSDKQWIEDYQKVKKAADALNHTIDTHAKSYALPDLFEPMET